MLRHYVTGKAQYTKVGDFKQSSKLFLRKRITLVLSSKLKIIVEFIVEQILKKRITLACLISLRCSL